MNVGVFAALLWAGAAYVTFGDAEATVAMPLDAGAAPPSAGPVVHELYVSPNPNPAERRVDYELTYCVTPSTAPVTSVVIDWGDGTPPESFTDVCGTVPHRYETPTGYAEVTVRATDAHEETGTHTRTVNLRLGEMMFPAPPAVPTSSPSPMPVEPYDLSGDLAASNDWRPPSYTPPTYPPIPPYSYTPPSYTPPTYPPMPSGSGGSVSDRPPLSYNGPVQVSGYTRKDGTYVRPHTRSRPSR